MFPNDLLSLQQPTKQSSSASSNSSTILSFPRLYSHIPSPFPSLALNNPLNSLSSPNPSVSPSSSTPLTPLTASLLNAATPGSRSSSPTNTNGTSNSSTTAVQSAIETIAAVSQDANRLRNIIKQQESMLNLCMAQLCEFQQVISKQSEIIMEMASAAQQQRQQQHLPPPPPVPLSRQVRSVYVMTDRPGSYDSSPTASLHATNTGANYSIIDNSSMLSPNGSPGISQHIFAQANAPLQQPQQSPTVQAQQAQQQPMEITRFTPYIFGIPMNGNKPISIWDKHTQYLLGCNQAFQDISKFDTKVLSKRFKLFRMIPPRTMPYAEIFVFSLLGSGAKYSEIKSIWMDATETIFYHKMVFHVEDNYFWIEHHVTNIMDDEFVVDNYLLHKTYEHTFDVEVQTKKYMPPAKRVYAYLEMMNKVKQDRKAAAAAAASAADPASNLTPAQISLSIANMSASPTGAFPTQPNTRQPSPHNPQDL